MNFNLQHLAKKDWYVEHFNGCPAFIEMTGAGFSDKILGDNFPRYSVIPCYFHDRQGEWMSLVLDQRRIGKAIIAHYIKNKKYIFNLRNRWTKKFRRLEKEFYHLYQADLHQLDDDGLVRWAKKVFFIYRDEVSMPGFLDGFMFYADQRLDELLRKFSTQNGIINYRELYVILTAPIEPSFIAEEEQAVRALTKKIATMSGDLDGKNKLLDEHLLKYAWIKSSYVGYEPYLRKALHREIKNVSHKTVDRQIFKENLSRKRDLVKKLKFTKEINAISDLTQLLIAWQDLRKKYTLTFVALRHKILVEVARRIKIDYELLRYTQTCELRDLIQYKLSVKDLKQRRKACLFIYANGKVREILTGKKVIDFYRSVGTASMGDPTGLSGIVANLGWASGPVRVVKSIFDIGLVKKGDILVTSMTRPEYLSAMKKAAAIVTDDGGITCHAAIVARELGKPCIIGTRLASRVLHNGDMVKVDANSGIVTILRRK